MPSTKQTIHAYPLTRRTAARLVARRCDDNPPTLSEMSATLRAALGSDRGDLTLSQVAEQAHLLTVVLGIPLAFESAEGEL